MAKYRYLSLDDRKQIEEWYRDGVLATDIATRLSAHHTTIFRELKRGYTGALDENQRQAYSAELAQYNFQESLRRKGKRAKVKEGS